MLIAIENADDARKVATALREFLRSGLEVAGHELPYSGEARYYTVHREAIEALRAYIEVEGRA